MAHLPSALDPTPARGLAHDISNLSPIDFTFVKAGAQVVAAGIDGGKRFNDTGRTLILKRVEVRLATAPTGADFIIDVNAGTNDADAGSTVFSVQADRPKVVAAAKSGEAVPARAGAQVEIPDGGWLTVDVDQIGSGVAGSDLRVIVYAG